MSDLKDNPCLSKDEMVIVLDMDHTIIGEAGNLCEYEIAAKMLKQKHQEFSVEELKDLLLQGLLRPNFVSFINKYRLERGCLIVIYTAAVDFWAKRIMNAVKEIVGYKFWCALLARSQCVGPNLDKCLYRVQIKLRSLGIHRQPRDFRMIDNNMVMQDSRLILVPSYLFRVSLKKYFDKIDLRFIHDPHLRNIIRKMKNQSIIDLSNRINHDTLFSELEIK